MHGEEGLVVSLLDGRMFKAKSGWYVAAAAAQRRGGRSGTNFLLEMLRDRPTLQAVPEHAIWNAVLATDSDDIISHCVNTLSAAQASEDAQRLDKFSKSVNLSIHALCHKLRVWSQDLAAVTAGHSKKVQHTLVQDHAAASGWRFKPLRSFCGGLSGSHNGEHEVMVSL